MKKKVLSLLLAFVMIFVTFSSGSYAAGANLNNPGRKMGHRDISYRAGSPFDNKSASSELLLAEKGVIPGKYSSVTAGKISPVKDQNPDGTCWAFSATSACEGGYTRATNNVESFSVIQLVNYFYNTKIDPLGNASNDVTRNMTDTKLEQGGNSLLTMWGLASWTNGALWDVLPYTTANRNAVLKNSLNNSYANDYDIAHLQNVRIYPYSTASANMNAIKEAIMEYGALAMSYYHDNNSYNPTYGTYYTKLRSSNHAVSVVGWNDNFPSSYFGKKGPAGNGAWLVKNSWNTDWGTDGDAEYTNSFNGSNGGYFWISYYDASIAYASNWMAFDFQPKDNYQYNYQYDGACGAEEAAVSMGSKTAAVYKVAGLTSNAENIKAFGVGVSSTNMSGTAYLYKNVTDGKPESGTLVTSVPFATTYAGYYTFNFPTAARVDKGENFSVVIKWNTSGNIFVDKTTSYNWISFTANTTNDKTYSISSTGSVSRNSAYTARLKAFSVDATGSVAPVDPPKATYTVTYDANGGTKAPAQQTKTEGESLTLSSQIPEKEGYLFKGWAVSATGNVVYNPGATYTQDADVTLYAVWEKNQPVIEKSVDVKVSVTSATTGKNKKAVTTYTAKITAVPSNTTVKTVQYSLNGGSAWVTGTSFSSTTEPAAFNIRVTDADGDIYNYTYSNGQVIKN